MADNNPSNPYLTIGEDLIDFKPKNWEDEKFIEYKVRLMLNRIDERNIDKLRKLTDSAERKANAKYQLLLARLKTFDEYNDLAFVRIDKKSAALANMARILEKSQRSDFTIILKQGDDYARATQPSSERMRKQIKSIVREYASKNLVGDARNIIILLSRLITPEVMLAEECEIINTRLLAKLDELGSVTIEDQFSCRPYNALKRAGINTFRDILEADLKGELSLVDNLGKKSLKEIREKINAHFGSDFIEELRETKWWTT